MGGAETMRINDHMRSQLDTKRVRSKRKGQQTFGQMVQSQTMKLNEQELQQMLEEISVQGEQLGRSRTAHDLITFKHLVKEFLEKAVYQGYKLQLSHNFNIHGNNQKLALVEEIDDRLVELTEKVMHQEAKNVDLLGLIGEIKGLLINLYT